MTLPSSLAALQIEPPGAPMRGFLGGSKTATIFLRADSEAAMLAAFAAAGIEPAEGETLPLDFHWEGIGDISIVGTIYNDDAVFDDDGNVVTPPTAKPGWHVNVLPAE